MPYCTICREMTDHDDSNHFGRDEMGGPGDPFPCDDGFEPIFSSSITEMRSRKWN